MTRVPHHAPRMCVACVQRTLTLPFADTFASKVAACQDEYADSSIGNVTGSNAVNVFLGIGIAWTIAAIYHATQGSTFEVGARMCVYARAERMTTFSCNYNCIHHANTLCKHTSVSRRVFHLPVLW